MAALPAPGVTAWGPHRCGEDITTTSHPCPSQRVGLGTSRPVAPLCPDMAVPRVGAADRRILWQGRIMETLAEDDAPLTGTLGRLGRRLELPPDELRACLRELARAGWIQILIQPFGRLTIRVAYEPETPPVRVVGCRSVPAAWQL